jgi:PAS domain S-box-containing protein
MRTDTVTRENVSFPATDSRPRILIVEDETVVALDLQQRLTSLGYTVPEPAQNGEEAIQRMAEARPDLVLMDIDLGAGMGGVETALLIQQQHDLPIIYVTANSDADTVRTAAQSGPFGYILKPFEDRELETTIQIAVVRHEMECRLKESERRFSATLTSVADGLIATDAAGGIAFFNPSAEKITGWRQKEALGRRLRSIFPLLNDGSHRLDTDFLSSFLVPGTLPGSSRTALLGRRDGTTIPVEYRAAHIHDERQHLTGIVISFSDIRERRQAEEAVQKAQEERNRTHEELKRKHEELQSFYHTVSHELKTPLTSAREFISLILEGLAGPVNQTQIEYLGIARESCDRMRTCINDMLDVTRVETGKMSLQLQPASLGDLARQVITILRPAARQKQIDLTCSVAPDLPGILMDETRIAQVITNLLNNALKFTPSGGVIRVGVGSAPSRPDQLELTVADTGRGIPAQHLPRIFDRLYQVRADDYSSCLGLGLGLHICQELVRLHQGSIRVESTQGRGTTFFVTLPLAPPDPGFSLPTVIPN